MAGAAREEEGNCFLTNTEPAGSALCVPIIVIFPVLVLSVSS